MTNDVHRNNPEKWRPESWRFPIWTDEVPDQELSIREHAEAIALVNDLRPYCTRWSVELQRPDIAREIGLIIGGPESAAIWAVYRDSEQNIHFEDLTEGHSYTFSTMSAGLRFVRAVLEAAAEAEAERASAGIWWEQLPDWLVAGNNAVPPGI